MNYRQLFLHGMWSFLVHCGCCIVVIANLVLVFEAWSFDRFDFYAALFGLIEFIGSLLPTLDCSGLLSHKWDNTVTQGGMGPSQCRYRRVSPPNCTSGCHGRVHGPCSYLNTSYGDWCGYQN